MNRSSTAMFDSLFEEEADDPEHIIFEIDENGVERLKGI